jgi:small conductance mechanosensitive channel
MIDWLLTNGSRIVLILILTMIALKITTILSSRLMALILKQKESDAEFKKRADTLGSLVRYGLKIGILVMAVMMIMGELGIQIGPILAAAGVLGLAIGFGARNLVEDIISGFFIFLENQIRVGDVVQVAGKAGFVEKVNLRMTILRDLTGTVHYVRNGQISVVSNMTKDYSCYVFDIGVAYREDVDEVMKLIREVDESLRDDPEFKSEILEPMEIYGLDQFADSALIIKARFKTLPLKQWHVAREFNLRLKKKFDEKDIEIPFPHRTLYMGKDKKGDSPVLNVAMEGNGQLGNGKEQKDNQRSRPEKRKALRETEKREQDKGEK